MKLTAIPFLSLVIAVGLALSPCVPGRGCAESVRKPVAAGCFYPANPSELSHFVDHLTRRAQKTRIRIPPGRHVRAIIMPHAGYIYSGFTAAHAGRVINAKRFSKVILVGPDHYMGFKNCAVCRVSSYETPLGKIRLHRDIAILQRHTDLFQLLPVDLDTEHSLEVILPFLQTYLAEFQLLPIIVGHAEVKRVADTLDEIIDADTLLVVSSDLSHYLSYSEANDRDRDTINWILNLDSDMLAHSENRACGVMPIMILIQIARRHNWQPVLLHYSNSGDTAGSRSRVVGYATIAFFGDLPMENTNDSNAHFNEQQGQVLVRLARKTITEKLTGKDPDFDELVPALQDEGLRANCGTFVTLKISGQLRGCIGNLSSTQSVIDGIKHNAINAAFHDPRFSPLSKSELARTVIEISILSEPQPLEYQDGRDLTEKLRVNVDGVIIRKGHSSATFLPQVWEQLPRPEDFLGHLCMKAGLPSDAWKNSELEVLTYQVQHFEEKQ
jgi:AmmeMemoRadiSam system protein B/AmmeMemoRadiSam system protein A